MSATWLGAMLGMERDILAMNESLRRAIAAARRLRDAGGSNDAATAPAERTVFVVGTPPWALDWESVPFTQPTGNGPTGRGGD